MKNECFQIRGKSTKQTNNRICCFSRDKKTTGQTCLECGCLNKEEIKKVFFERKFWVYPLEGKKKLILA